MLTSCIVVTAMIGMTVAGSLSSVGLSEHNRVRSHYPVPKMRWSGSIANMAQNYANGCSSRHSTRSQRQGTGENIYMSSMANMDPAEAIKQAIESWESEKADYDINSNYCGSVCGHFTQLIWKTSTEVGCGVGNCPHSMWKTFVVCNYKGPGNYYGEKPY
ncbi:uncharacterized protein LOC141912114 [Tubulanus polymorphus]|uniref:uncharacterized protein LOC141912114 n=1 Tax=Tubulanus polymorphus TaxID=672921 RepID=UPI003DA253C6